MSAADTPKPTSFGLVLAGLALALPLVGSLVFLALPHEKELAGSGMGGPFNLVDQHGKQVTETALFGHPSALFFGYTSCPDVCPTTLARVTSWLKALGDDAGTLQVYFITVDPDRDSQLVLSKYLAAFSPKITALTGPSKEIDKVLASWHVYAKRVPTSTGDYTMDHTAGIFLLDDKGRFQETIDYLEEDATALAKLKKLAGR